MAKNQLKQRRDMCLADSAYSLSQLFCCLRWGRYNRTRTGGYHRGGLASLLGVFGHSRPIL
jgi:hypothetical protein